MSSEALEKPRSFPTNYADAVSLNRGMDAQTQACRAEAQKHERQAKLYYESNMILHALLTSWSDDDPGKYSLSVSFVGKDGYRILADEFLPPDTKRFTEEEWQQANYSERRLGISAGRRVVPFAEVLHAECTHCHEDHPVLEWYKQTFDSPSGDEWLKRWLLLCTKDEGPAKIIELSRDTRGGRF